MRALYSGRQSPSLAGKRAAHRSKSPEWRLQKEAILELPCGAGVRHCQGGRSVSVLNTINTVYRNAQRMAMFVHTLSRGTASSTRTRWAVVASDRTKARASLDRAAQCYPLKLKHDERMYYGMWEKAVRTETHVPHFPLASLCLRSHPSSVDPRTRLGSTRRRRGCVTSPGTHLSFAVRVRQPASPPAPGCPWSFAGTFRRLNALQTVRGCLSVLHRRV